MLYLSCCRLFVISVFFIFCRMCGIFLFFFFKQKTAYEMRISDWSSDVCSSDLPTVPGRHDRPPRWPDRHPRRGGGPRRAFRPDTHRQRQAERSRVATGELRRQRRHAGLHARHQTRSWLGQRHHARSEEHTSELQSLMRNSYAVFCLKKKKYKIKEEKQQHIHPLKLTYTKHSSS